MDDELRRLERLAKAGDPEAHARWCKERGRRGFCAGGLDKCEVGIAVDITEHGRAELRWGSALRPHFVWSIDLPDTPDYPRELVLRLNANPAGLRHGFEPVGFVFRPTPFGVLAFGCCHACEKGVPDPQDIVIDPGPRWGSAVPLWMRRGAQFAQAVEQAARPPWGRILIDYPDPRDHALDFISPSRGLPRPRERRRIRHQLEWEPWMCGAILSGPDDEGRETRCGSRDAGRVVVVGDPETAKPFVTCPACGRRGPTSRVGYQGVELGRWRPRPTRPRAPSPPGPSAS